MKLLSLNVALPRLVEYNGEAVATERMEAYDTTTAGRAIGEFVDDLSNWYVRASRKRFYGPDGAAFSTLRECLLTVAKLLAPFCPFVADEIYSNPKHPYTQLLLSSMPGRAQ